MVLISIKIVALREFGLFLGQSYLYSQNMKIELHRNIVSDVLFLLIPMILMNLVIPKKLNRFTPKETLFSSLSVMEFIQAGICLFFSFLTAFLYGSLTINTCSSLPVNQNHFHHLGRQYFTSTSIFH